MRDRNLSPQVTAPKGGVSLSEPAWARGVEQTAAPSPTTVREVSIARVGPSGWLFGKKGPKEPGTYALL